MNSLWFSNKKLVYCLHGHIMQKTSLLYWQIVHSPSSVFYTSAPQDASVLFLTVLVAVTYDMYALICGMPALYLDYLSRNVMRNTAKTMGDWCNLVFLCIKHTS